MKMEKCLLRDLKGNTEMLILSEFLRNPSVKRKDIAERLNVTEQAISQYISDLDREGLLSLAHSLPKPTRKGIQLLQERFSRLNEEIREILRQIRVIDICVALADQAIKTGDEVGLVMRNGRLVAIPGKHADSSGIARGDAKKGEEVLVGDLSGVVELNLGELIVLQVPSEISGGSRRIDVAAVQKTIRDFKADEIAVGDLVSDISAKKIGLQPTLSHAPIQASINALSKGLNVLFIGTHESADEILSSVEELRKKTGYAIRFRLIDIGKSD